MLKTILFSLLFFLISNQENQHKLPLGNDNHTNVSSSKSFEHGRHSRKLLNVTSVPTTPPTIITDSPTNWQPTKSPTRYSKADRAWIYSMIAVASVGWTCVFLKAGCIIHRKCKDEQIHDIAYPLEISNKGDTNNKLK